MKNILITGVAGFIGSYLAEDLLSNGYYVWGMDNLSNGSRENLAFVLDNERFNFFEHDVCDEKFIQNLIVSA